MAARSLHDTSPPHPAAVEGKPTLELFVHPRTVAIAASAMAMIWWTIHLLFLTLRYAFGKDHVFGLEGLFHLGKEASIPTWYSSVTLCMCGLLLSFIAWCNWRSRRPDTVYWVGLAVLFFFVSLDESISIHEIMTKPLRDAMGFRGMLYQAWVIPYGLAMVVLGGLHVRFLLRLPAVTRARILLALVIFLGGAIGMEMIGGVVFERGNHQRALPIDICVALEEGLEMLGVAVFSLALVGHLHREFPTARLAFSTTEDRPG